MLNASFEDWTFVALGSNLGDSAAILRQAARQLSRLTSEPLRTSSLWESMPVDCPPGSPNFVNAVVAFRPAPDETPELLLTKLQALERQFGRGSKKVINEARPLDLDLIAFGAETRNHAELILPHPHAHVRRFVLQPLDEIAPDLLLPGWNRSVRELFHSLDSPEVLRRIGTFE